MHTIKRQWDIDDKCSYCKKQTKIVLKTEHDVRFTYKGTKCNNCGKKLSIKVPFDSSGHDSYENTKDLEKRLAKGWV